MTQNNLGSALSILGGRESGTAKLEEAVAAYREALKEQTHERAPLDWAFPHPEQSGRCTYAPRRAREWNDEARRGCRHFP
jgi:hypothetical protein